MMGTSLRETPLVFLTYFHTKKAVSTRGMSLLNLVSKISQGQ